MQIKGACGHDCPDTCGWVVDVVDGEAVKMVGDPDHPFTRGTLCAKVAVAAVVAESAESACCCGHSHAVAESRVAAAGGEETGAQVSKAGHDAENCPLCTLLAKIKEDPALLQKSDVRDSYLGGATHGLSGQTRWRRRKTWR